VARQLDFVSVHFYPDHGKVDAALRALQVYAIGKPLVVAEMFPLRCSPDELDEFIDRSRGFADGWLSFYWGESADDYERNDKSVGGAITAQWIRRFAQKSSAMRADWHRR